MIGLYAVNGGCVVAINDAKTRFLLAAGSTNSGVVDTAHVYDTGLGQAAQIGAQFLDDGLGDEDLRRDGQGSIRRRFSLSSGSM